MDFKKYNELRQKINTKDFEGKNTGLDKWLFGFSFIGNIGSIFFAYFLVYPSLLKAIVINFVDGFWGNTIAFIFTIIFLIIFEIIKRYIIQNFSHDFIINSNKIKPSIFGWLLISLSIIILSFYLSISGSKNLASTSMFTNKIIDIELRSQIDSINSFYVEKRKIFVNDNDKLREINNDLREKLTNTPTSYRTIRSEYQTNIDKNVLIINNNQQEIIVIDNELENEINQIKNNFLDLKTDNKDNDIKNIFLFIIIVVFNELIIIGGLYFREYYEYNLYKLNHQKFEKIYQKKDRYRALLTFIYNNGKVSVGEKVISGLALKDLIIEKTTIQNPTKFVGDFFFEMDRLGVFNTVGKRRFISLSYEEAMNIVENYDDALRILENIK